LQGKGVESVALPKRLPSSTDLSGRQMVQSTIESPPTLTNNETKPLRETGAALSILARSNESHIATRHPNTGIPKNRKF
jgi:hypothetical protein